MAYNNAINAGVTGLVKASSTGIFSGVTVTNHATLIGAASNSITSVGPSATAGQYLQSGGASADPAYSTATLPSTATGTGTILRADGTNWAATTATYPATTTVNQILYSSATNVVGGISAVIDGVLISNHAAGVPSFLANGTAGFVLTAQSGAPPAWAAVPSGGITTINGDTGSVTGSTITLRGNGAASAGTTVVFSGSSSTMTLNVTDVNNNTCFGLGSGKSGQSGSSNSAFGFNTLNSLTSGINNTCIGYSAGVGITTARRNTLVGMFSGQSITTSGWYNTAVGYNSGTNVITGTDNTFLGNEAGTAYTSSESSNICIGSLTLGTVSESNALRIGVSTGTGTGQINKTFVAGIQGITVTGTAVLISSSDQLGIAVSSSKFKNDIKDMEDVSDKLASLRPVNFVWNKESSEGLKDATDDMQYGLIAEEVDKVFPYLCVYDKEGKPLSVKYNELPALLLKEIQKLTARIAALESK